MTTPAKGPQGRGMGKGLGALGLGGPLPTPDARDEKVDRETPPPVPISSPIATRKSGLLMVPITAIAPNPYQPRKHIDPEVLATLAQSIRENGLIQPPVVSFNPDYEPDYQATDEEETGFGHKERKARYLLIAGERRWQASKLAGLIDIPVVLKEVTPVQMLEMALVENIQRADLNPLEEALAYRQLMQEFKLTQEAVAQRVGKNRATVANALRLFDLPENILQAVYDNKISEGHARGLLMLDSSADQQRLLHDIIAKKLSVRQTEETARRLNAQAITQGFLPDISKKLLPVERETRDLEEQFRNALSTNVTLSRSSKGGKLIIQFFSDEELNELYNKIVGSER